MTEATVETPAETPAAEEAEELGEGGKKALATERARAARAEKALKALQDAQEERDKAELSELERVKRENTELLGKQNEAALESIRYKVALEKGIPAELAPRLTGNDYDEISADADSLVELVQIKQGQVRIDPSQGPKAKVGALSPADELAAILRK
jgi:hypothetical protein